MSLAETEDSKMGVFHEGALDALDFPVHIMDRGFNILYVNKALKSWCLQLGVRPPDPGVALRKAFEFLPANVLDEYRRVFESGKMVVSEESTPLKGGDVHTRTKKIPLLTSNNVDCVLTVINDVTEEIVAKRLLEEHKRNLKALVEERTRQLTNEIEDRKAAEAALKKNEETFRTMAEFSSDCIFWRDADGGIIYISPACQALTEYSPRQFYKNPKLLDQIVHPDDRGAWLNHVNEVKTKKHDQSLELRLITRRGRLKWVSHVSRPILGDDGSLLGRRGSHRDISEYKKAMMALEKERNLFVSGPVVMFIWKSNVNMTVEYVSPNIAQFGYDPKVLASGKVHYMNLVHSSDKKRVKSEIKKWARSDEPFFEQEYRLNGRDGEVRWVYDFTVIVRCDAGKVVNYYGYIQDITDRKNEERLREDIERVIRHELKTPLSGIIGIPNFLKNHDNLTDEQKRMVQLVQDSGMQMLNMINQHLNLFKLENDAYELDLDELDMAKIVCKTLFDLSFTIQEKNLRMVVLVDGKAVEEGETFALIGDPTLMRSIAANLMKNAVEAAPKRTWITINMKRIRDGYILIVKNKGVVAAKIKNRFFDKYVTYGKNGGTGLGTYTVKLMAERHGGSVSMTSTVKRGTAVTVKLPKLLLKDEKTSS